MEEGTEEGRRRCGGARDRISGLPDELLHEILGRLGSSPAAARTSALSRRWLRVWTHLPDLVLRAGEDLKHLADGASFLDAVDGALESYDSAADLDAHLQRLEISVRSGCRDLPASRVAPWLRFAARRVAGALFLRTAFFNLHAISHEELELPPCERATSIRLLLREPLLLRPPPIGTGTFAALSELEIARVAMDARELEVLVSSQCPRLLKLILFAALVDASDVSLRYATLRHLNFQVRRTRRLDVAAPALQVLDVSLGKDGGHIAATDLAKVSLSGRVHGHIVFADAGRHLQRLEVKHQSSVEGPLMQRFDTVNELRIPSQLVLETKGFIPNCKTLWLSLPVNMRVCVPCMMRLMRRSNGIRKLVISAHVSTRLYCLSSCPCLSAQSATADIILDHLKR